MKRAISFICFVITLGVIQSYSKSFEEFFSSNENLPYRTLLMFAHPFNNFEAGHCFSHDDLIIISIDSKGNWSDERYNTEFILYTQKGVFTKVTVTKDTYPSIPCFHDYTITKYYLESLYQDYTLSSIEYLERLYGKSLRDMEAEELCVAVLSLMLLEY